MRSAHNPCNLPCYFHGRDSPAIQRIAVSGRIQVGDGVMDGTVEAVEVDEGSMRKVARFQVAPDDFDVVQNSGAYLGNHSTLSQWARSASAARLALLTWMGPLSRTRTTGFVGAPGLGP